MTLSAEHEVTVVAAVAAIVAEVLGFDEVAADEDLFALGMTSLSAVRIIARVNETFDVDLDLLAAFDALTPAAVARLTEESLGLAP